MSSTMKDLAKQALLRKKAEQGTIDRTTVGGWQGYAVRFCSREELERWQVGPLKAENGAGYGLETNNVATKLPPCVRMARGQNPPAQVALILAQAPTAMGGSYENAGTLPKINLVLNGKSVAFAHFFIDGKESDDKTFTLSDDQVAALIIGALP